MPYILYYIVISLCNDDVSLRAALEPADKHRRWRDASFNRKNQIEFNHVRERERKKKENRGSRGKSDAHIWDGYNGIFFFRTEFA